MAYRGVSGVVIDAAGELEITTLAGHIHDSGLVAWQDAAGQRREVQIGYSLEGNTYRFRLGDYDATQPLVISHR